MPPLGSSLEHPYLEARARGEVGAELGKEKKGSFSLYTNLAKGEEGVGKEELLETGIDQSPLVFPLPFLEGS